MITWVSVFGLQVFPEVGEKEVQEKEVGHPQWAADSQQGGEREGSELRAECVCVGVCLCACVCVCVRTSHIKS